MAKFAQRHSRYSHTIRFQPWLVSLARRHGNAYEMSGMDAGENLVLTVG